MNEAAIYATITKLQKMGASTILKTYGKLMKKNSEQDTVLDVGCGVGDVTRDILLPFIGRVRHIVGGDISTSMLEYAREHFPHERLTYEYMDITYDVENVKKRWAPFSRIYSFNCLNWSRDHQSCFNNIASLLTPSSGECLLVVVNEIGTYGIYRSMARNPRWAGYMTDVEKFIPDNYGSPTVVPDFRSKMEVSGFDVPVCELVPMCFKYDNVKEYKHFLRAINPFYLRLPENEQDRYLNEVFKLQIKDEPPNVSGGCPLTVTYSLLVAYGRIK